MKVKVTQSCPALCDYTSPWNSLGYNTGVGSLSLLQGAFPTQGSNPGIPRCRWILYQLSHQGSPRILEWVAYPFSRGSSQPRTWTGVSCIAGEFFTSWTTRESSSLKNGEFFTTGNWKPSLEHWEGPDGTHEMSLSCCLPERIAFGTKGWFPPSLLRVVRWL